jgi:hypothetical protein
MTGCSEGIRSFHIELFVQLCLASCVVFIVAVYIYEVFPEAKRRDRRFELREKKDSNGRSRPELNYRRNVCEDCMIL